MIEDWQHGGFGLYIHWPFCESLCPYCDFNSYVSRTIEHDVWAKAYCFELERTGAETSGRVLRSIYFGGGTPSLMEPATIAAIISRANQTWTFANDIEITLEANPSSVERGKFQAFKDAGINRVSLGVQALNDRDLRRLGRRHNSDDAMKALSTAQSLFDRVSFDLIYARQDQSLDDWQRELDRALRFGTDHLSLYQLTIEGGTAFGDRYARGALRGLPSEDLSADMFFATQEICEARGRAAYETSNHAAPGQESRHNRIYWQNGDYVGIGPGAHGRITLDGARYATETYLRPDDWLASVDAHENGESKRVELGVDDRDVELLLMGLRLYDGVLTSRISNTVKINKIIELEYHGLMEISDGAAKLTKEGRPLLNSILNEII